MINTIKVLSHIFCLWKFALMASSFSPNSYIKTTKLCTSSSGSSSLLHQQPRDIIDAEVITDDDPDDDTSSNNRTPSPTKKKKQSLLQASLSSIDKKLSSLSFNFVDPAPQTSSKQNFIPCRVAFMVEHEDVEYVLGTPVDTAVGIYVEDSKRNEAWFLDPDEDDNMEIMERAVSVFQKKYEYISLSDLDDYENDDGDNGGGSKNNSDYGDDSDFMKDMARRKKLSIRFKRTPRALTVEGDLSMVTGNWKKDTQKQLEEVKDVVKGLFENSNESSNTSSDDDYFDNFFKNELGSNYREEALANTALEEEAKEMMDLFNIPGLGTEKDNEEGLKELFDEMLGEGKDKNLAEEESNFGSSSETALRLVGFNDENDDRIVYSLVQLLQPMILIAKNQPGLEFDERLLLTDEEAQRIVPILEQQFKDEFESAGIQLMK